MSDGVFCVSCRKYIGSEGWHCACPAPRPSDTDPEYLAEQAAKFDAMQERSHE